MNQNPHAVVTLHFPNGTTETFQGPVRGLDINYGGVAAGDRVGDHLRIDWQDEPTTHSYVSQKEPT